MSLNEHHSRLAILPPLLLQHHTIRTLPLFALTDNDKGLRSFWDRLPWILRKSSSEIMYSVGVVRAAFLDVLAKVRQRIKNGSTQQNL
jgi:hypothetical protein